MDNYSYAQELAKFLAGGRCPCGKSQIYDLMTRSSELRTRCSCGTNHTSLTLRYSSVCSDNQLFIATLTRCFWLQLLTTARLARATPTPPAPTPKAATPAPATRATRETDPLAQVRSRLCTTRKHYDWYTILSLTVCNKMFHIFVGHISLLLLVLNAAIIVRPSVIYVK